MERYMKQDQLDVYISDSRDAMGKKAAQDAAACIHKLLETKDEINMIFAAAPSQNEVLHYLMSDPSIPWNRINAFHMDEYIGLPVDAPQGFANFLRKAIFDQVPFKAVYTLNSEAEAADEIARYTALLEKFPTDIVCMGIGENGHIAFNDPHVAFFHDPVLVKTVDLDETCRMQQVHDGCFASLDLVPKNALTLTIPALTKAAYQFCVVPAATKANAVKNTVLGPVSEACPASILRTLPNATLYCDPDSGKYLL